MGRKKKGDKRKRRATMRMADVSKNILLVPYRRKVLLCKETMITQEKCKKVQERCKVAEVEAIGRQVRATNKEDGVIGRQVRGHLQKQGIPGKNDDNGKKQYK